MLKFLDVPLVLGQRQLDSDIDDSQVCRTCALQRAQGQRRCTPGTAGETHLVYQDGTRSRLRQATSAFVRSVVATDDDGTVTRVDLIRKPDKRTRALIDTCGQEILPKCRNCAHFMPLTIGVDAFEQPDGTFNQRQVQVGGACRIGPEGILVEGRRYTCVPTPRDRSDGQSCNTCAYLTQHWDPSFFDAIVRSPMDYELSPYERHMAEEIGGPDRVGLAIATMRERKGQRRVRQGPAPTTRLAFMGLQRYFLVAVEGQDEASWRIRFLGGAGLRTTLAKDNSDDTIGLLSPVPGHGDRAVMAICSPYELQRYGVVLADVAVRPRYPQRPCPRCGGRGGHEQMTKDRSGRMILVEAGCGDCGGKERFGTAASEEWRGRGTVAELPGSERRLVSDIDAPIHTKVVGGVVHTCVDCAKAKAACYWHAKIPLTRTEDVWNADRTDDTGLPDPGFLPSQSEKIINPAGWHVVETESPERILHLDRSKGSVRVLDANGQVPGALIFKIRLRSLLEHCRNADERAAVVDQLATVERGLPQVTKRANLAWNRPADGDPWHPICSLVGFDRRPPADIPAGLVSATDRAEGRSGPAGIDFFEEWNDVFGTPREKRSSSVIAPDASGFIEVLPARRETCVEGSHPWTMIWDIEAKGWVSAPDRPCVGHMRFAPSLPPARIYQGLRRDPMFSPPLYDERNEWFRCTNPGEFLQSEMITTRGMARERRERHQGCPICETWTTDQVGEAAWNGLIAAHQAVRGRVHHTILPVGLPGTSITGADVLAYQGQDPTASVADQVAAVVDYHYSSVFIPGSDQTNLPGFWTDQRGRIYGYSDFRNAKKVTGHDIPSVWVILENPQSDPTDAGQEMPQGFICSSCGSLTDMLVPHELRSLPASRYRSAEGGSVFHPAVNAADPHCPVEGCEGTLLFHVRRPGSGEEWQGANTIDNEQITAYESYRRRGGPTLAVAPDTAGWSATQRLMNSVCSHWSPRRRRRPGA